MADSIENCIESIMSQIDNEFEVVVVDDNSTDDTSLVLKRLSKQYPLLKHKTLPRDPLRKLGLTRNYSIEVSRGEWCLFHIDADDTIGVKIRDFIVAVETLDGAFQKDKLYAGKQIHMARRSFLLKLGPFRNLYRGEDRDLYERLVASESWVLIDHERFIFRQERPKSKLIRKNLLDATDQSINDFRKNISYKNFYKDTWNVRSRIGFKLVFYKYLISVYARHKAKLLGELTPNGILLEDFISYRESHTKSLSEWCRTLQVNYPSGIDNKVFF